MWGAAGAIAPEVLRLYNMATDRAPGPFPRFGLRYFVISVFFLGMGGAFAVAWGEDNPFKCLWVGMSLPVIISTFMSQIPK